MKALTSLKEVIAAWGTDSKITPSNADAELLNIGSLHSKYGTSLAYHNIKSKELMIEYNRMHTVRREYYSGGLSHEELAENGWEQNPKHYKTQGGLERMLANDKYLNAILLKKIEYDEASTLCLSIIKELNNRSFQINGYLAHQKFLKGLN